MLINILRGAFERAREPQGETLPSGAASPFPGAKERSVVVVCFGMSRSDPFKNVAKMLADIYSSLGLHCYVFDMLNATWPNLPLEALFRENQVRYGVGWGGIGADAEVNVEGRPYNAWLLTGTPFFKMIGDHPAYFLDVNHSPSALLVNVYGFAEHRDFYSRHMQTQAYGAVVPLQPIDPLEPSQLDFKAKESGKIVFLKNGNDPEALRRNWHARLPASVARILMEMSEDLLSTLASERTWRIEELVVSHFADLGVSVADRVKFLAFYIAQLDDYLRRIKSNMIAESLLDFPIEVHGECWEHLDFAGRKATLVPFGDYARSKQLIADGLCVLDMAPNTHSVPHERFMRCASRYTLCLTNRIDFLEQTFAPFGQPLFDFTPDSIRESVSAVLDDPARHVEIGRAVGVEFARLYSPTAIVDFFEMMADQILVQEGEDPQIQPFLVWPPKRL